MIFLSLKKSSTKSIFFWKLSSIPKRRELVREAARNPTTTEVKATQQEQQAYRWTADPLSGDPLRKPVVSDCRGTLYNKDAVIDFLLPVDADGGGRLSSRAAKAEAEEITRGEIKSLRDVVEVKFELEEAVDNRGVSISRHEGERWKCPVTNERLGPGARAVYLIPCGHAFAESVIKELADDRCLQVLQHSDSLVSQKIKAVNPFFPSVMSYTRKTT